eukprot:6204743-Pleurochrysis_carterae.AAC.4
MRADPDAMQHSDLNQNEERLLLTFAQGKADVCSGSIQIVSVASRKICAAVCKAIQSESGCFSMPCLWALRTSVVQMGLSRREQTRPLNSGQIVNDYRAESIIERKSDSKELQVFL